MTGALTDRERAEAGFFDGPAPAFETMVARGEPVVMFDPGWPFTRQPAVVIDTGLDGSMWIQPKYGHPTLVPGRCVDRRERVTDLDTARAAARRVNDAGLTFNQVRVLEALAAAGDHGMIDHDHQPVNGLGQDTAGKRRGELVARGLVAAKNGPGNRRLTPRGSYAQVWVITTTGRQALRPATSPPPLSAYTAGIAH